MSIRNIYPHAYRCTKCNKVVVTSDEDHARSKDRILAALHPGCAGAFNYEGPETTREGKK